MDFANMTEEEFARFVAETEGGAQPGDGEAPGQEAGGEPQGQPGDPAGDVGNPSGQGDPAGDPGQTQNPAPADDQPPQAPPAQDPSLVADAEAFRQQQQLQAQQQYANGIYQSFLNEGFDDAQAQALTQRALAAEQQHMDQAAQAFAAAVAKNSEMAWSQANPDFAPKIERLFSLVGPSAAQALRMEAIQSGDYGGFLYRRAQQLGPTQEELNAKIQEAAQKAATEALRKMASGAQAPKEGHTSVNALPGMPSGSSPAKKDPRYMTDSELAALDSSVR